MSKRVKILLIPLALLISAWLIWARIAHNRLKSEIDAIAALHEPIYAADLDFSPIPDTQNAAHYYILAFNAISTSVFCPSESNSVFPDYPPYPPAWHQMVDQAVAANAQALLFARKARDFDRVDWGSRPSSPLSGTFNFNYFNPARALASNLADAALKAHVDGDDAEAFQRIFDLLHLANAVEQRGLLIGRYVSLGVEWLAVERIEILSMDLQVKGHSASSKAVDRLDLLKIVRQFLDAPQAIQPRRDVLMAERVAFLDQALAVNSKATILRPMVQLAAAGFLDEDRAFLRAAEQTNWPAVQTVFATRPRDWPNTASPSADPPRFSRLPELLRWHQPSKQYLLTEFRFFSEHEIAAISLAANLYRLDHGNWPPNLQSLVGDYLPAVPEDPFYASPQSIGYILIIQPNGVIRPLLYLDPAGAPSFIPPPNSPSICWQFNHVESARQWRDISLGWMITPTTSPSPH